MDFVSTLPVEILLVLSLASIIVVNLRGGRFTVVSVKYSHMRSDVRFYNDVLLLSYGPRSEGLRGIRMVSKM